MPKLNKKIITIYNGDLNSSENLLEKKVESADFIAFNDGKGKFLPHKNYFQAYSLMKSGKDISCCDYYVYSKSLGDYLAVPMKFALNTLGKNDFCKLLNMNQLMMKKGYFLKNIKKFKSAFDIWKLDLIDEQNTNFVSIPLMRINSLPQIEYHKVRGIIHTKLIYDLNSLNYNGRLLFSTYPYNLILGSIIFRRYFVLRYILESFLNRKNWNKLIKK